jgi:hypothetical protein
MVERNKRNLRYIYIYNYSWEQYVMRYVSTWAFWRRKTLVTVPELQKTCCEFKEFGMV